VGGGITSARKFRILLSWDKIPILSAEGMLRPQSAVQLSKPDTPWTTE
jgi:hypothetical protein